MNKLSLVGMQLPENYTRTISTFRAKALCLELLDVLFVWNYLTPVWSDLTPDDKGLHSKFSLYFSGSYIPTKESLFILYIKMLYQVLNLPRSNKAIILIL
jgi:hypothetical protein